MFNVNDTVESTVDSQQSMMIYQKKEAQTIKAPCNIFLYNTIDLFSNQTEKNCRKFDCITIVRCTQRIQTNILYNCEIDINKIKESKLKSKSNLKLYCRIVIVSFEMSFDSKKNEQEKSLNRRSRLNCIVRFVCGST